MDFQDRKELEIVVENLIKENKFLKSQNEKLKLDIMDCDEVLKECETCIRDLSHKIPLPLPNEENYPPKCSKQTLPSRHFMVRQFRNGLHGEFFIQNTGEYFRQCIFITNLGKVLTFINDKNNPSIYFMDLKKRLTKDDLEFLNIHIYSIYKYTHKPDSISPIVMQMSLFYKQIKSKFIDSSV